MARDTRTCPPVHPVVATCESEHLLRSRTTLDSTESTKDTCARDPRIAVAEWPQLHNLAPALRSPGT